MRIGITCYPTYGGSGVVATELGLELAERGHEVHFVSYAQPFRLDRFRERVYFHEVEMDPYPLFEHPPYSVALAAAIHDVAVQHELDLIHVHYAIPHATSAWMAREMLLPGRTPKVVTTLHGTDITLTGKHPSLHSITRFSIQKSDGITAVSEFLRKETETSFGVNGGRSRVIPNFIDPERYRRDGKPCHRATLAPGGEKILMHISNFRPVKRVEDVVRIFARVRAEGEARLVMVGDGPDRPRAQALADSLGVANDVIFLGKHTPVEELLACSDLFLLPSESESFGLAALEAMACGSPVIATAVAGLPEVVEDGETGFLHPLGDVEGMARSACRLLGDDSLWTRFSEAGQRRARDEFSADRIVSVYESFYEEVLAGKGGGKG